MISSISTNVFGDSVGLGFAQAAGLLCDCKVGRQPHEVLAAIMATPANLIRDRRVILSTGLSNNPDGRSFVESQVRALMDCGVSIVVMLGVGPGVGFGTNEWLADLSANAPRLSGVSPLPLPLPMAQRRVKFAGPLVNTRDDAEPKGIHPWSYDQVVDQVEAVL